jgi:hypothetical protein
VIETHIGISEDRHPGKPQRIKTKSALLLESPMVRSRHIRMVFFALAASTGIALTLAGPLMAADPPSQSTDPPKDDELRPYHSPLEEALIALEGRHYDVACPALRRIVLVDHTPANLFLMAQCHDQWGKVATAYEAYGDYLDMVDELEHEAQLKERVREDVALARYAALEKRVPWVKLYLPITAPANTLVTRRSEDGGRPVRVVLEKALPIDPGEHVVYTRVPTGRPYMNRLVMREGEKRSVVLDVDLEANGDAVLVEPIRPEPPKIPPLDPPSSARRIAAYGLGITGVAGLGLGLTMGGLAFAQSGTIAANCQSGFCLQPGIEANARRAMYWNISSVAVPAGLVAIGAGVTLYLTEPTPPRLTQTGWQLGVGGFPGNTNVQVRASW